MNSSVVINALCVRKVCAEIYQLVGAELGVRYNFGTVKMGKKDRLKVGENEYQIFPVICDLISATLTSEETSTLSLEKINPKREFSEQQADFVLIYGYWSKAAFVAKRNKLENVYTLYKAVLLAPEIYSIHEPTELFQIFITNVREFGELLNGYFVPIFHKMLFLFFFFHFSEEYVDKSITELDYPFDQFYEDQPEILCRQILDTDYYSGEYEYMRYGGYPKRQYIEVGTFKGLAPVLSCIARSIVLQRKIFLFHVIPDYILNASTCFVSKMIDIPVIEKRLQSNVQVVAIQDSVQPESKDSASVIQNSEPESSTRSELEIPAVPFQDTESKDSGMQSTPIGYKFELQSYLMNVGILTVIDREVVVPSLNTGIDPLRTNILEKDNF